MTLQAGLSTGKTMEDNCAIVEKLPEMNFFPTGVQPAVVVHVLDAVVHAVGELKRIDEGTYGRCAHCGEPIGPKRLEALPWAKLCIDCQELLERGLLGSASILGPQWPLHTHRRNSSRTLRRWLSATCRGGR